MNPEVIVFVLYLISMLAIGVIFFIRDRKGGEKTFFLGDRKVGAWFLDSFFAIIKIFFLFLRDHNVSNPSKLQLTWIHKSTTCCRKFMNWRDCCS